jgi:surfeit locus 1 family protein
MKLAATLFSRRWLLATALAAAGCVVLARLGIWQLDRLAQRREFNARALAWVDAARLELDAEGLRQDLYNMEYRPVTVTGEYAYEDQVALKNQQFGPELGVVLLTPLRISGTETAILVARGWIPQGDASPEMWAKYDGEGEVALQGVLRRSEAEGDFGALGAEEAAGGERKNLYWNLANVERIARQSALALRPDVYVQLLPDGETAASLPYPLPLNLEISEGSHAGYAAQWFTFAALLGIGYPAYVQRHERMEAMRREDGPARKPAQ